VTTAREHTEEVATRVTEHVALARLIGPERVALSESLLPRLTPPIEPVTDFLR
jgi:hypothetical protein